MVNLILGSMLSVNSESEQLQLNATLNDSESQLDCSSDREVR